MINFSSDSIYQRALEKLQQDPDWKVIANNSVVSSLLRSNAEVMSETARYAEYLFQESKWDTAQNPSSILAMANMLGYQPKRKTAATGKIYVSCDPRTYLVSKTITPNAFKALSTSAGMNSISPVWSTSKESISISSDRVITDSKGHNYIAIGATLPANAPYAIVDVIQGKRAEKFIDINTIRTLATKSKLDPYIYIPVVIDDCEDARTPFTRPFFNIYVKSSNGNGISTRKYRVTDSLLLSENTDYDVEVYNDLYDQSLFYLKFNNDRSRGPVLDLSSNSSILGITIEYVVSLGAAGNLNNNYETFSLTSKSGTRLYGINLNPIIGGADAENLYSIKANAPKTYMSYYTAGTKEAYKNTVLNTTFYIYSDDEANGSQTNRTLKTVLRPKKVRVYGKDILDTTTNTYKSYTCISFIANNLEDSVSKYSTDYTNIDNALDFYLDKIKSPQDSLKFVAPNYTRFTVGLTCNVDKDTVEDLEELKTNVRDYVNELWGPNSDYLDFDRSFYPSELVSNIKNEFSQIRSIDTEVEAVQKLDWSVATRETPISQNTAVSLHTVRLPFDFSQIFSGSSTYKGFKDYRVGGTYTMRIDILYKKPRNYAASVSGESHKSIFVRDWMSTSNRSKTGFFLKKESGSYNDSESNLWLTDFSTDDTGRYLALKDVPELTQSYQFSYVTGVFDKVYTDSEFTNLIDLSSSDYVPVASKNDPGYISDYLIYFSGDYTSSSFGSGWIEMPFDPIYKVLSNFAAYDVSLNALMSKTDLSLLKCDSGLTATDSSSNTFAAFIEAVKDYVDIYVCMRPIDNNLIASSVALSNEDSIVLYIDSSDSDSLTSNFSNISSIKNTRMISINCQEV